MTAPVVSALEAARSHAVWYRERESEALSEAERYDAAAASTRRIADGLPAEREALRLAASAAERLADKWRSTAADCARRAAVNESRAGRIEAGATTA